MSLASYLEVRCVKEAGPQVMLEFSPTVSSCCFQMTLDGYSGWTLCLYLGKDFHKLGSQS